ncbi:hypothetical protein ACLB2K_070593 [Fragaria x ananassa]
MGWWLYVSFVHPIKKKNAFLYGTHPPGSSRNFPAAGVLVIMSTNRGLGMCPKPTNTILSSKTETWKPMEILPPGADVWMSPGVFFRDALHWLARCRRSRPKRACHMYAFDLEKEEFSIMQLPSALQTPDIEYSNHGVTREGCLYVMVHKNVYRDGELDYYMVEFWVMRDYGNNDSWTRSFGVKIPSQPARKHWYLSLESISVSETSALVRNRCPLEPKNSKLLSTSHYRNEEENSDIYVIETYAQQMVGYEESMSS